MSYATTQHHVTHILNPATLGHTVILARRDVEDLIDRAYTDGIASEQRRVPMNLITFEGKPLDPDKLAVLLSACRHFVSDNDLMSSHGVIDAYLALFPTR